MNNIYDVVVVGGGPAGLTSALYLARAKYKVLVVEKESFGGQITITEEVVNYPGVFKTSGKELTETMRKQAESFGASFTLCEVLDIIDEGDFKIIKTTRGDYKAFGVVIATGAHPRNAGFIGEDEFKGRGVAYCATCDGEFFTGKDVYVVGGGFAAAEEAVFLTRFAKKVIILVRDDDFTCAKSVADHARSNEKIEVLTNTAMLKVDGNSGINYISYQNLLTNEITEVKSDDVMGVFVFAGYVPATDVFKDKINLDEYGYIVTDSSHKTNIDGIYAAGDVCIKNLRQVVTAVSDGALCATELEKYCKEKQSITGIVPEIEKVAEKPIEKSVDKPVESSNLFSSDMVSQLNAVFSKMASPLKLKLHLDSRPVSNEVLNYMTALSDLTDKLSIEIVTTNESSETAPVTYIYKDDKYTGASFHGVPGGHEFTSFVLALYNSAGPGQQIDDQSKMDIAKIDRPLDIKVLVSLSCTMCPELVASAQRIATLNPNVTCEVYDIAHFESLKSKYNVMSVPCIIFNDKTVHFGKKNIPQLLEIIKSL